MEITRTVQSQLGERHGSDVLNENISCLQVDGLLKAHNFGQELLGLNVVKGFEAAILDHLPAGCVKPVQHKLVKSRNGW